MTSLLETEKHLGRHCAGDSMKYFDEERNNLLNQIKEREKNTDTLHHGLSLLYRLMLIPNDSLVHLDRYDGSNSESEEIRSSNELKDINSQLDQLCEINHLHNTPFTLILAATQRLKSNLQHVTNEVDVARVQISSQQQQLKLQSERMETMEAALKKLFGTNTKMKKKVSSLELENKTLSMSLDEVMDKSKTQDFDQHGMVFNESDLSIPTKEPKRPTKIEVNSETNSIISSLTSCPSPKNTGTGLKTLTLKYDQPQGPDDSILSSPDASPELCQQRKIFEQHGFKIRNEYKMIFDGTSKIGLHFYQMPVDKNGNILDKGSIPLARDFGKSSGDSVSSRLSLKKGSMIHIPSPAKKAFLVCGYNDFDKEKNVCPPIGSRLMAINQESLEEGDWTIGMVVGKLTSAPPIVLTFQDYCLTKKQLGILKNASRKLKDAKKEKRKQTQLTSTYDTPLLRDFSNPIDNSFEKHEKSVLTPKRNKVPVIINTSPRSIVDRFTFRWN